MALQTILFLTINEMKEVAKEKVKTMPRSNTKPCTTSEQNITYSYCLWLGKKDNYGNDKFFQRKTTISEVTPKQGKCSRCDLDKMCTNSIQEKTLHQHISISAYLRLQHTITKYKCADMIQRANAKSMSAILLR
jgi:hypothetical protein